MDRCGSCFAACCITPTEASCTATLPGHRHRYTSQPSSCVLSNSIFLSFHKFFLLEAYLCPLPLIYEQRQHIYTTEFKSHSRWSPHIVHDITSLPYFSSPSHMRFLITPIKHHSTRTALENRRWIGMWRTAGAEKRGNVVEGGDDGDDSVCGMYQWRGGGRQWCDGHALLLSFPAADLVHSPFFT